MKRIIDDLEKLGKEKKESLRDIAAELGTDHSKLSRYKNPDHTFNELFALLERMRKKLKYSKSKFWDILTGS